MIKKKVLILGNGPSINQIDFSKLPKNLITFGVNRIWLKHFPNHYFFQDDDIIKELESNPIIKAKLIAKSNCFSSDWFRSQNQQVPPWLRIHERHNRRSFPDSVTTGMRILHRKYLKGNLSDYIFYIAGVSLKWKDPSHFWKEMDHASLNTKNQDWYDIRFTRIMDNFRELKSSGFNMVSVTPDSTLNKMLRYENINNLYIKPSS